MEFKRKRGEDMKKKGISLIILATTVVIMMILITTVTISGVSTLNRTKKMKFATEVSFIQEMVNSYKMNHMGEYPVGNSVQMDISGVTSKAMPQFDGETRTATSTITLYEIDLNLLGKTDLTYGNRKSADDIYLVSKETDRVYYAKGLKASGNTYYTLTEELQKAINYSVNNAKVVNKDGIVFMPSTTEWTNQKVITKVGVPTSYFNPVVRLKQNNDTADVINSSGTEGGYTVFNVNADPLNVQNNYDITVTYQKTVSDAMQTQNYSVNNFDNVAPTLIIQGQQTLKETGTTNANGYIYIDGEKTKDTLSGIKVIKYENEKIDDSQKQTYFRTNGIVVHDNVIQPKKGVEYVTIYVEDNAGNATVQEVKTSSIYTLDDYVKNGLILQLDGINNTGNGHSNNTTTWKDLSGKGHDATLSNFNFGTANSGWTEDRLVFDGVDDKGLIPNDGSLDMTDQTIEIVVKKKALTNSTDGRNRTILFVKWFGYTMELNSNNSISYGRHYGQSYLTAKQNTELNRVYSIVATTSGLTQRIYMDAVLDNQQNVAQLPNQTKPISFGYWADSNSNFLNGEILAIRMYNRPLTEQEIMQNYQVDCVRFGI